MRKYSTLYLIVAALTGAIGFSGLNFSGIEVVRVLFLIFADLLVVSLVARLFFGSNNMRLQRIKK
ncbi:DUF1328 domain-containing protein [Salegentibacter sp. LM13S]|uniref:DUF1328 domain-containing protein n=1 Tax=Salegentibacter lacus TaxID=2873599 RepID=UPI001CD00319|nr:DUF1328 domain-containing protein [Salegentibacter lacus]MBZ9630762.1 DUF1328 domain-containing protein [Salegentibacter lacus]